MESYTEKIFGWVQQKNSGEPEFHQAVKEVLDSLEPVMSRRPEYQEAGILEK